VNTKNHTFIAEFPIGEDSYDACVDEYISKKRRILIFHNGVLEAF
jgi:hypothetical protein